MSPFLGIYVVRTFNYIHFERQSAKPAITHLTSLDAVRYHVSMTGL